MQPTTRQRKSRINKTYRLGGVRMTPEQQSKLLQLSNALGVPGNTSAAVRKLIDITSIEIRGGHSA